MRSSAPGSKLENGHADGGLLPSGGEKRWENSNFPEIEMANMMTEAASTPDVT